MHRELEISLDISFIPLDAYGNAIEIVNGIIFKPTRLPIFLDKFSKLEMKKENALSLLAYHGDFEDQLHSFVFYFKSLLENPKMQAILSGIAWDNTFYKPWHEGTDY